MKKVMPSIISEDQTGFMENRSITHNIRKAFEVMQYSAKFNKPALIMTVDFEKCFDRKEYSAVPGSLTYFGFGSEFISWIDILSHNF